jgi:hypothetical protein
MDLFASRSKIAWSSESLSVGSSQADATGSAGAKESAAERSVKHTYIRLFFSTDQDN